MRVHETSHLGKPAALEVTDDSSCLQDAATVDRCSDLRSNRLDPVRDAALEGLRLAQASVESHPDENELE